MNNTSGMGGMMSMMMPMMMMKMMVGVMSGMLGQVETQTQARWPRVYPTDKAGAASVHMQQAAVEWGMSKHGMTEAQARWVLDFGEAIKVRPDEYDHRTLPMLKRLEEMGFLKLEY